MAQLTLYKRIPHLITFYKNWIPFVNHLGCKVLESVAKMAQSAGGNSKQTAIRLPQGLYDRLEKAAGANGTTVAEQIRTRLEASFKPEQADDPKAQELLDFIALVVRQMNELFSKPWHDDPFAWAVLRASVTGLLDRYRPEGEAVPKLNPKGPGPWVDGRGKEAVPTPEDIAGHLLFWWQVDRGKRVYTADQAKE